MPLKVVAATVLSDVDRPAGAQGTAALDVQVTTENTNKSADAQAAKELSALLLDLSRRSLQELADPIHAVIENLTHNAKVRREAHGNGFETFAREGATQRLLDYLVTQQVLLIPAEHGNSLRKLLLEQSHEARDTQNNLLRVVYLRITS